MQKSLQVCVLLYIKHSVDKRSQVQISPVVSQVKINTFAFKYTEVVDGLLRD